MKTKLIKINTAILSAALLMGATWITAADEEDTSANTIAYWKLRALSNLPEGGVGLFDLATNVGQGTLTGSASVPASVDNLLVSGPIVLGMTFANVAPPLDMFNTVNPNFNGGTNSWDSGADVYSGPGGEVYFDPSIYGNEMTPASFTEEIVFKTDYTNDPTLGTVKQTLIWNHQTSAFAELQLNESAAGNTNDIGSLLFWGYNVSGFPTVRITAAQNGGQRFDDGNWHYAACRFNGSTLVMDIIVVNQDGSSYEQSQTLTQGLFPGGAGDLIIGNDESLSTPFDGLVNQVRISNASLPNANLIGAAPLCTAPLINGQPLITTQPANSNSANTNSTPQATNNAFVNDLATITVSATGTNPQYQWLFNGSNISGQTNSSLNLFPVTTAEAGTYSVIITTPCNGMSVTSNPAQLNVTPSVRPVVNIARWSMEFQDTVPNNIGVPSFTGIDDSDTNNGEGVFTSGTLPASIDDLITFNSLPGGGPVPLSNNVPPTAMFINGNTGGTNAFAPIELNGVNGALFFPQDQYGDEMDFQTSFSIELFFLTTGDQSGSGKMELVAQGSDSGNFRYGVDVNEAAPGAVTFAIENPSGGSYQTVSLTNANYADGNWHYLLAQYDSTANQINVTVANSGGSASTAAKALPTGFSPLFAGNTGNMFLGRYNFNWSPPSDDPRNFNGLIDEVQVSSGWVTSSGGQLGYVPAAVVPHITSISVSSGTVTIKFTGSASDSASSFTVLGSGTVNGTYSSLAAANITSLGSGNFQATVPVGGSIEFYRIRR